jgi:hypothetical protein
VRALVALALSALLVAPDALDAQSAPAPSCGALPADTARLGPKPVYPECGVDRPAEVRRKPRLSAEFPSGTRCLSAEMEFVVDERGRPITSSAVLLNATTPAFGTLALRNLARWDFKPATRGGAPVRQLVVARITSEDDRAPFVIPEPGRPRVMAPPQPACR